MSSASIPPASGNHTPQQPSTGSWSAYDFPASDRPDYYPAYSTTTFQPTAEQLARDEARRRDLRRNVYAPILVAVVVLAALLVLVVVLAFAYRTPEVEGLVAGMSAIVVILFAIPLIFVMSILPIAWLALTYNRRQKRKEFPETGPMAYRSRVQTLLWQLDKALVGVRGGVESGTSRLRRPLIRLHSRAAWLGGLLDGIRGKFTRSV